MIDGFSDDPMIKQVTDNFIYFLDDFFVKKKKHSVLTHSNRAQDCILFKQ